MLREEWNLSPDVLGQITSGTERVTPTLARQIERAVGMPARFWLGLQRDWDTWQARHG